MKMDFINREISANNIFVFAKSVVAGALVTETWYFSQAVALIPIRYIEESNADLTALMLCGLGFGILVLYLYSRNFANQSKKLIRSKRIDVLLLFAIGSALATSFGATWHIRYLQLFNNITFNQFALVFSIPFIFFIALTIRQLLVGITRPTQQPPFFIGDLEKQKKQDDLLGFYEKAMRFAERAFNGGSSDSVVFGIDAPWGIGKSTFINFCIDIWREKYPKRIIIYKFSPLRYEDRSNLLEKFVDGLIRTIQANEFVPELRTVVSRYTRLISKGTLSSSWLALDLIPTAYTVDDALEDLEVVLDALGKKIIIVVDDLDRLPFSAIKDVLFAVKKSFTLPNVTYVLCYDTENIANFEREGNHSEKITEFLEKFVNVKVSLFLDSKTLSSFISENLNRAIENNLQIDPQSLEKIRETVSAVVDIYGSQKYHHYQNFLGDVRKLKRLINTLVLLEIEQTDFQDSDFNKSDLLHLLLIYIHYPNIFRKIYNSESGGKHGFFSLVAPYEDGYPKEKSNPGRSRTEGEYKNSVMYTAYVEKLEEPQRFLISQIFDASIRLAGDTQISEVSEEIRKSYACFNSGNRNLEAYLNLISNLSKPYKRDQYRFYLNARTKLSEGISIDEILSDEVFANTSNENSHQEFWRVIANSANKLDKRSADAVINYLLDHIVDYSLIEIGEIGIGLRHNLSLYLLKILDAAGWRDPQGAHRSNTGNNLAEIAEWILCENSHEAKGVINTLAAQDRGVLGLYDLMLFRLFCSADRNGGFYNLQNSLSLHGDQNAPTAGLTTKIAIEEMREISQKIYKLFEDQYIKQRKNIFDIASELTVEQLSGKYYEYLKSNISSGVIKEMQVDNLISATKAQIASFIVYQLGYNSINYGVGCGYYDLIGKQDRHGISAKINNYLFDICFDKEGGRKNFECFMDYLLTHLSSTLSLSSAYRYVPSIQEFTQVLNKDRLANYWRENKASIIALSLTDLDKKIYTRAYVADYKEDLPRVYTVLDELLSETASER